MIDFSKSFKIEFHKVFVKHDIKDVISVISDQHHLSTLATKASFASVCSKCHQQLPQIPQLGEPYLMLCPLVSADSSLPHLSLHSRVRSCECGRIHEDDLPLSFLPDISNWTDLILCEWKPEMLGGIKQP